MSDDLNPIAVLEAPVAAETVAQPVSVPDTSQPSAPVDPETKMREAVGRVMDKIPGAEVTPKPETAKVEEVKPPEQVQPKTDEEKAAEAKAVEDAKAAAAPKPLEPPNPLDSVGPLPVATLAKAITDTPELAAALEKAGLDPELLYETSRQAALTSQFTEIFPTPEAAQFAGENAEKFYQIEEGFPKIQNVEDFDKFLTGTMLPMSVLRGGDGQPLMTADGKGYQTDGSIARFLDSAAQFETIGSLQAADRLLAEAAKIPGEEGETARTEAARLKEAIQLVQTFRDNKYRMPGAKQTTELSPEHKAEMDRLRSENAETQRVRAEASQKENETYVQSVFTDVTASTQPFVQSTLDRTSLNDNEKRFIAKATQEETWESLKNNRHFQMQKEHLYSLGNTPEVKARLVALTNSTFQIQATKVMNRLVTEAGGKVISANKAKLAKIDAQQTNDKMNQGTGTTAAPKTATLRTPAENNAQARENLLKRGITHPEDWELLQEVASLKGLARSA